MSIELTNRHRALLRAVGAGRCELSCSCEPTLYIDGRGCCDQQAAHVLVRAGLIAHDGHGRIGQVVPATLTAAGRAVLGLGAAPGHPPGLGTHAAAADPAPVTPLLPLPAVA